MLFNEEEYQIITRKITKERKITIPRHIQVAENQEVFIIVRKTD